MLRLSESATPPLGRSDLVVLLTAGALLVALRAHAFPAPLEADECNYLYVGQRLNAGDRLYESVWDHQPPLMFALAAALTRMAGPGALAYRSLVTAVSLVNLLLVFLVARRGGGRAAGWLAAGLFAICSSDPGTAGEGGNRELFMNALLLAAFLLWARPAGSRRFLQVLAGGFILGLASVLKTVVAAHWLAVIIWLGLTAWHRDKRVSGVAADKTALTVGPVAVWLITWLYFVGTGRHSAFIDAVFLYNLGYSGVDGSWWARFISFFDQAAVFRTAWPLWLAGFAGMVALPWRRNGPLAGSIAAMVIGSYVAVCLPGRFWPHYYYLLVPWLTICAGLLLRRLIGLSRRETLAWLYALAAMALLVYVQARHYLLVPPDGIAVFRYGHRMAWARDQGRRVGEVTGPEDTVYVYGSDTGIYYYSGRRCATRFTMIEPLSAERDGVQERRELFMADFLENRPRVV
ncbi:MAG: glycosyltransferase family 39 protein, partial [Phycisphaerales bacterium]